MNVQRRVSMATASPWGSVTLHGVRFTSATALSGWASPAECDDARHNVALLGDAGCGVESAPVCKETLRVLCSFSFRFQAPTRRHNPASGISKTWSDRMFVKSVDVGLDFQGVYCKTFQGGGLWGGRFHAHSTQ